MLYGGQVMGLGMQFIMWVLTLSGSVTGVFISLFLYISHDDMKHMMLEPGELSENLNTVSVLYRT